MKDVTMTSFAPIFLRLRHIPEGTDEDEEDDDRIVASIQKHEQRTLNYLVNEYLLQHNYKLTSITFRYSSKIYFYFDLIKIMDSSFL
jgi:hypothetical protein